MTNTGDFVKIGNEKVYDLTGNVAEWVKGIAIEPVTGPRGSQVMYVTCDCGDTNDNPCLGKEDMYFDEGTGRYYWCFHCGELKSKEDTCRNGCKGQTEACTESKEDNCVFRMCVSKDNPYSGYPICKPYKEVKTQEDLFERWQENNQQKKKAVVRGCSYDRCYGWPDEEAGCGMRSSHRVVLSARDIRDVGLGFRCAKDAP